MLRDLLIHFGGPIRKPRSLGLGRLGRLNLFDLQYSEALDAGMLRYHLIHFGGPNTKPRCPRLGRFYFHRSYRYGGLKRWHLKYISHTLR